jgi:PPOX class probable F420-dependent enzyme
MTDAERASLDPNNPAHAAAGRRLRSDLIVWLTTVDENGQAQSTPVWFWWDGASFLIFSQPHAQKLRNLAANPRVSLHLEGNRVGGDNVIFEGTAEILADGRTPLDAFEYLEKYRSRIESYGWTAESFAADYSDGVRVTPTRARIW